MCTRQVRTIVSMVAFSLLVLNAGYATAQQTKEKNSPTGDIKPAQTDSPGAHPVSDADNVNNDRQASDRQENNNRQRNASDRNRTDGNRRTANGNRGDGENNLNRQLAACLLMHNKAEVELGKLAADRVKNSDVKEFAEQMVKDHGKAVEKLEQIVGSQEPNDKRSQISREIDEECLASLKKELSDKSDKEFDACYMGSQIAGHMHMAATLKVLSGHTSGELNEVVKNARPTVDKHLAHAKKIMGEIAKSSDNAQAAKERSDKTR